MSRSTSQIQIFTAKSGTPSVYVPPLTRQTNFHTHIKRQVKLRLIHTERVEPLPCSIMLCRSHLNYTVRTCPMHTSRAVPLPCSERSAMKENSQGHDTVRPAHSSTWVNFTAASQRPVGATSKSIPGSYSCYHADFTKVVIRMFINHEINCSWRLPK